MELKLPFDIGDPLYWTDVRSEGEGPVIAEIKCEPHGIEGVRITQDGTALIVSGTNEDETGTQYACLDHSSAVEWLVNAHPGALNLTPGTTVKAIYTDVCGMRSTVMLDTSIHGIEKYVPNPMTTEPDRLGYMAIVCRDARKDGAPITSYVNDAAGHVLDAIFGSFLLVKVTEPNENGTGFRSLENIGDDILKNIDKPKDATAQTEYSPRYWTKFKGMTVDDLCRYLKDNIPGSARVNICGTSPFWLHYAPAANAMSLDCEDLGELPEYEDLEPSTEVTGSAGEG